MIIIKTIFQCTYCDAVHVHSLKTSVGMQLFHLEPMQISRLIPDDWHILDAVIVVCGNHDIVIKGKDWFVKDVV
ncbi:hypothetical protein LCGC14_2511740 [marine sediment metagenome]|uniref:Uncharacterized protein n=1 Tax=marine sediment metagenome TaxID=412755 RepID=A0A0F9BLU4_9ZZZZ